MLKLFIRFTWRNKKKFKFTSFQLGWILSFFFFKLTKIEEQRKEFACSVCIVEFNPCLSFFVHLNITRKVLCVASFMHANVCVLRSCVYTHVCFYFLFSYVFLLFFFTYDTWKLEERRDDLISKESTKWNERNK